MLLSGSVPRSPVLSHQFLECVFEILVGGPILNSVFSQLVCAGSARRLGGAVAYAIQ